MPTKYLLSVLVLGTAVTLLSCVKVQPILCYKVAEGEAISASCQIPPFEVMQIGRRG